MLAKKVPELNKAGYFVLKVHRLYHEESNDFKRSYILRAIFIDQLFRCTKAQQAFKLPDSKNLKAELVRLNRFKPDP